MTSSASIVDSEDFSKLDNLSTDGLLYATYGYVVDGAVSGRTKVRGVEVAELAVAEFDEGGKGRTDKVIPFLCARCW